MRLIFVVGPARSGTSAVCELLSRMGVDELPPTVGGDHNPHYHENLVINALAEAIHPWHKVDEPYLNPHFWEAMASYILEGCGKKESIMLKSPVFPFITPQLEKVAAMIDDVLEEDVEPWWVRVHRNQKATALSQTSFTNGVWSTSHWAEVTRQAHRIADAHVGLDKQCIHVDYEDLLADWRQVALQLDKIPGTILPADGGIRPELNHYNEGVGYARKAV